MPAGTDWPRITTRWIACRLIAMLTAWRTRTSANGFLPFTSDEASSGEPTSKPKKIVRFSGPSVTRRFGEAFSRSMSCTGTSCTTSTSPESSAATRVASCLMVVSVSSVISSGTSPAAPIGVVALDHGLHVRLARHQHERAGAVGVAHREVLFLVLEVLRLGGVVRLRPLLAHDEDGGEIVGDQRVRSVGLELHGEVVDLHDLLGVGEIALVVGGRRSAR